MLETTSRWPLGLSLQRLSAPALSPNRGGYTLTMRECQGSDDLLAKLASLPPHDPLESRLHLGWGSFRNLDIAAARRSHAIVLLDVNRHQFQVWDAVAEALRHSRDAPSFIEALLPRLPTEPRLRQFAADTGTWLRGDLERPGSWLERAAPERWAWIRDRFAEGAVMRACVDLRDASACAALCEALDTSQRHDGLQPDTVYVSNIPWMLAQPLGFFGEAHPTMPEGAATSMLEQVRLNLAPLASGFRWAVTAMQLRADAPADNLQWQTELCGGAELADHPAWRELAAPQRA